MSTARVELQLPGTRRAPGMARRAITAHLGDVVSDEDLRTLTLLVSELVTNAVRHTGAGEEPVGLVIDAAGSRIRVEVHDSGPGFECDRPRPHPAGDGGYGLVLVERMADRWGVRGNGGSQVWFELDRRAA